jgi:rRNA maturation endonuclease Nob1
VYVAKNIEELNNEMKTNAKSFSIITSKIAEILIFDYEGCSKCRKKIEVGSCLTCGS